MSLDENGNFNYEETELKISPEERRWPEDKNNKGHDFAKDFEELLDEILAEIKKAEAECSDEDTDEDAFDEDTAEEEGHRDYVLTLISGDGEKTEMEFIDLIEDEGERYAVFIPHEKELCDEAVEVIILKAEKDDMESTTFTSIEDEALLEKIYGIFKENNGHLYNFVG